MIRVVDVYDGLPIEYKPIVIMSHFDGRVLCEDYNTIENDEVNEFDNYNVVGVRFDNNSTYIFVK